MRGRAQCVRPVVSVLAIAVMTAALAARPARAQGFRPLTDSDFRDNGTPDAAMVQLGQLLFFDPVLSGNRNISCASCHHPLTFTGDALSLPIGEGGDGVGVDRTTGSGADRVRARVPRNAPALFNLGARQFRALFHDGRVAEDGGVASGFSTPAGDDLPQGLADVLAAQAMFPVSSGTEMAGQRGENDIGRAAARGDIAGVGGVWDRLAERLRDISEYVTLFNGAFDDVATAGDITFVHAANAIAAFEASAFRTDDSPFDRYLRGEIAALGTDQQGGMNLFYGRAGCARCHAGPLQTDQRFHPIAMPQIGPGKDDGIDGLDDFGRERVTGDVNDRFAFRTPSLRNVELTGPWGHDGAYGSLDAVVRHYRDPRRAITGYDASQAVLPSRPNLDRLDFLLMSDPTRAAAIAQAARIRPVQLDERDITDLVAFLRALTDARAFDLSGQIPARVPSGLRLQ